MNKTTLIAAIALAALGTGYADFGLIDKGDWPATWPKELEPLRKQARTLSGPMVENRHYAIPFTKREDFEAAWPHLLKVKSPGTAVLLTRAPNFYLADGAKAGVVIHTPPLNEPEAAATKVEGKAEADPSLKATYLELVVDGEIVDLNRIAFPAGTLVRDERFKDPKSN